MKQTRQTAILSKPVGGVMQCHLKRVPRLLSFWLINKDASLKKLKISVHCKVHHNHAPLPLHKYIDGRRYTDHALSKCLRPMQSAWKTTVRASKCGMSICQHSKGAGHNMSTRTFESLDCAFDEHRGR